MGLCFVRFMHEPNGMVFCSMDEKGLEERAASEFPEQSLDERFGRSLYHNLL